MISIILIIFLFFINAASTRINIITNVKTNEGEVRNFCFITGASKSSKTSGF